MAQVKQETEDVLVTNEPHESGRPGGTGKLIRGVCKMNQKRYAADEKKARIVVEGLRKKLSAADLCRREGLSVLTYYTWVKDFDGRRDSTIEG